MKIGYSFFADIVFVSWWINRCCFSMWFSWEGLRVMVNSIQLKIHATIDDSSFCGCILITLGTRCYLHIHKTRWEINFWSLICCEYKASGRNALIELTKVLKKGIETILYGRPFPQDLRISRLKALLCFMCAYWVFLIEIILYFSWQMLFDKSLNYMHACNLTIWNTCFI